MSCLGTMCALPTDGNRAIETVGYDGPGGTGVVDDSRTSVSLRPVGDHFGFVHYDQIEATDGPMLLWDFRTNRYARRYTDPGGGAEISTVTRKSCT